MVNYEYIIKYPDLICIGSNDCNKAAGMDKFYNFIKDAGCHEALLVRFDSCSGNLDSITTASCTNLPEDFFFSELNDLGNPSELFLCCFDKKYSKFEIETFLKESISSHGFFSDKNIEKFLRAIKVRLFSRDSDSIAIIEYLVT